MEIFVALHSSSMVSPYDQELRASSPNTEQTMGTRSRLWGEALVLVASNTSSLAN